MPEIIEQLVWPVAMIFCVLILRKPLSALVRTTKRVKYKDVEVEFNEQIQRIEAEVAKALPVSESATEPIPSHNVAVDLYQFADVAPNASVVEAWRSIEKSAKNLIKARGHDVDYDVATPYKVIQDVLVSRKIIEERSGKVFEQLRQLRNKVRHADGYELTPGQATDYIDLAVKLRGYLDFLAHEALPNAKAAKQNSKAPKQRAA